MTAPGVAEAVALARRIVETADRGDSRPENEEILAHALLASQPDGGAWLDAPLPEDAEISAAHPMKTGRYDTWTEAMRLVGARHSKDALVSLVNWLLSARRSAHEGAEPSDAEIEADLAGIEGELAGIASGLKMFGTGSNLRGVIDAIPVLASRIRDIVARARRSAPAWRTMESAPREWRELAEAVAELDRAEDLREPIGPGQDPIDWSAYNASRKRVGDALHALPPAPRPLTQATACPR